MIINSVTSDIRNLLSEFELKSWLSQFEEIEFYADFDMIDKPMLIDLIADWKYVNNNGFDNLQPIHLPNIRYDKFYDIHTIFKLYSDDDINRIEFSNIKNIEVPFTTHNGHNALYDAYVCYLCYNKLIK